MQGDFEDGAGQAGRTVLNEINEKKGGSKSKEELKKYIIKRIRTEVEIGHKINHPNIVKFVYFTETPRNIYIFMELC